MRPASIFAILSIAALSACSSQINATTNDMEVAARWDHRPEADLWNSAMMQALRTDGAEMLALTPEDIQTWCPGYADASEDERAAFYVAFFSGLARFESTWNPRASGGGGRYRGLLQISPQTAQHHDCSLPEAGLFNGAANLACAVRIATSAVTRDGVVAAGRGGIAADWPPMRDPAKRREVAEFTRALPQCEG
ncbi:transglycosylase SLT domain-containing protein [Pararhodobacter sp.]|uniref:transglycosylase SLT domain-containing protein n=1 Tax=Pararhodobacter sp. TaxID=2127056 RepID=UPI002AFFA74F|nr:transglycosylase SLT domain-containing protein [Pararhodobacter sp.]